MRKPEAESNPVSIGPASAVDAEAVAALIHRAFAQYRGKLQPESGALSESADTIAAAMALCTVLVAIRAGRIVGCVSVQFKEGHAYAGRLAVDAAERGVGIGGALIGEAEVLARRMGLKRLRVDARLALAGNRAFFRRLGFAEGAHRCHAGFAHPTYVELEKILI